jgi:hypothetical protein
LAAGRDEQAAVHLKKVALQRGTANGELCLLPTGPIAGHPVGEIKASKMSK